MPQSCRCGDPPLPYWLPNPRTSDHLAPSESIDLEPRRLVARTIMWKIETLSVESGSDQGTVGPGQPSYVGSPPLGCRGSSWDTRTLTNPSPRQSAWLVGARGVQGQMAEERAIQGHDTNVQISHVEPYRSALMAPPDGDMGELRVVAKGDLATGIDLVGRTRKCVFAALLH